MERKIAFMTTLAALMIVGIVKGYRSDKVELELCKKQARDRLVKALDDGIPLEEWHKMLNDEVRFLTIIANK